METNFQKVVVDCILDRKALILNLSVTRSRTTATSSVGGAPKGLILISPGLFLKKAMRTSIMMPPKTPIDQKATFQEEPLIITLIKMAMMAGPSPWDACKNPTP
jgi:hypothetical protein